MSKRKRTEVAAVNGLDVRVSDAEKVKFFAKIMMNLKLLNDNVVLRWRPDGMRITIHDANYLGVALLFVPAAWFDSYSVALAENEEQMCTHIRTGILKTGFSKMRAEQTVRLFSQGADGDTLSITFNSPQEANSVDDLFEIPLMDLPVEDADNNVLVFKDSFNEGDSEVDFQVSSARWAEAIKFMKLIGSSVTLFCSEQAVQLSAHSEDTCKYSTPLGVDSIAIMEGATHEECFGLRILFDLCAFTSIAPRIEVQLLKDRPVRLVFLMENEISFVCHVVPRAVD